MMMMLMMVMMIALVADFTTQIMIRMVRARNAEANTIQPFLSLSHLQSSFPDRHHHIFDK